MSCNDSYLGQLQRINPVAASSSSRYSDTLFPAENCMRTHGNWLLDECITSSEPNAWVAFDFEAEVDVRCVLVYPRDGNRNHDLGAYTLSLRASGDWEECATGFIVANERTTGLQTL